MFRTLIVCSGAVGIMAASAAVQAQAPSGSQHSQSQMDHGTKAGMSAMQGDDNYVSMMLMHHDQGIEMARAAADKGQRSEVKELASKILNGQQDEKKELQQIQTGSSKAAGASGHDMSGMHDMSIMPEMKKGQQAIDRLKNASGADVDQLFLTSMQEHHQTAIQMSQKATPTLKRAEVQQFATKTVANQKQEIAELKQLQGSGSKRTSK